MANILNIDTSTDVCSVALTSDGMILCHREDFDGQNHAKYLSGFIKFCLDKLDEIGLQLDAVSVSMGPGSYTGLRIGLSEAKGLAFALGIPLIGVDTLKLLTVSVMFSDIMLTENTLFIPMIDARRDEVFTAVYDNTLNPIIPPTPLILTEDSFSQLMKENHLLIFGNGSDKAKSFINSESVTFIPGIKPLATDMLALSEKAWFDRGFIDLAYSTPWYRKEFQATVSKKTKEVLSQRK